MEHCVWFGGSQSKSLSGQARPGRRQERQTQIDWLWRRLWRPCNAKSSDDQYRTFWWSCSKEGQTGTKELMKRPQIQEKASHRETKQEKIQRCRGLGQKRKKLADESGGNSYRRYHQSHIQKCGLQRGLKWGHPGSGLSSAINSDFGLGLVTSLSLDFFGLPSWQSLLHHKALTSTRQNQGHESSLSVIRLQAVMWPLCSPWCLLPLFPAQTPVQNTGTV